MEVVDGYWFCWLDLLPGQALSQCIHFIVIRVPSTAHSTFNEREHDYRQIYGKKSGYRVNK